jgi:hypothetical protein
MTEYPFDVSNGAVLATFGGSPSLTPAAATTWGQIKSHTDAEHDRDERKEPMKHGNLIPLLLLIAAPAWSAPTLSMNWGGCSGPVSQANTGSHNYSLYVSVVGVDGPHMAYQVDIAFGTGDNTTPDAWLYDSEGYGELSVPPAVSIVPESELSQVCPALSGDHRGLFISKVRPRPEWDTAYPPGTMQALVAIAYDRVETFDPNQRYFMARIDFDHSTSVEGEGVPGTSRAASSSRSGSGSRPAAASISRTTPLSKSRTNRATARCSRPSGQTRPPPRPRRPGARSRASIDAEHLKSDSRSERLPAAEIHPLAGGLSRVSGLRRAPFHDGKLRFRRDFARSNEKSPDIVQPSSCTYRRARRLRKQPTRAWCTHSASPRTTSSCARERRIEFVKTES